MTEHASGSKIIVRHCHGLAEFEACVELQRRIWAGADIDVVPLPLFVVAAETGGEVLGAYEGSTMVGFTMALAGIHDGRPFLHSHMTAVLENHRDRGVGRQLKLFQRQDAISRGMDLVEWTFDPLEIKNSYFNLVRLGAIARRYLPNFYGITTSPLHAGIPTDRLMAEWLLRSPRVEALLAAGDSKPSHVAPASAVRVRIRVPGTIEELRRSNPPDAIRIQSEIRRQFLDYFSRGYAAVAVEVHSDGADYLLEPWSRK
jgi:predicted GNAT superfamily acetyltransferase